MQNEYFVNLMKYPQLGYWNLHTNLGIYYDNDKHIVGNTHYAYYIFQDEKSISKPQAQMNNLELEGRELQSFGYDMGVIIGNISSGLSETSDFMESDVIPKGRDFYIKTSIPTDVSLAEMKSINPFGYFCFIFYQVLGSFFIV